MKKYSYTFILLILTYIGCNKNSEFKILTEEQQVLNLHKPELVEFLDLSTKKVHQIDKKKIVSYKILNKKNYYLFKDGNNDFSIVEITDNEIIYENLTTKNDLVNGKILNFSFEEDRSINFSKIEVKDKLLLSKTSSSCESEFWLDVGLCTIGAATIAASDGPLPFMDGVAVTFFSGCFVRATQVMDRCNGIDPVL